MFKYDALSLRLKSLTVFRGLLDEPLIVRLSELLRCEDWDKNRLVELYCAFVSELYKTGDSLSDWIRRYISEDENLYVQYIIDGRNPGPIIAERLDEELGIISELASLDCGELLSEINAPFPLPIWRSEAADLRAAYEKRIDEIPTRGYGIFAKYHMFVLDDTGALVPVRRPDPQRLSELYGYEEERGKVLKNTLALLEGRPANNVLLYGDAGTGKSSTVKAVANELKDKGLRLIEVKKNQLYLIPGIMDSLEGSPLKYIIFIDDLSFSTGDSDFAALKAILEGSVGSRGKNMAVYATSNRRHLIRESMSDRDGDDIHLSDTLQELQSLSARFGLTVTFIRPEQELYREIVLRLGESYGVKMEPDELCRRAEAFAIRSGGRSPRAAKQFVELVKAGIV
ncbi:MAG: ATP-binding protein [Oscillospiraceae bacterium]|nr:ATP-binding protein [Oscillospiraceae bacterium]